ncbi:tyrosine-type recombinase/integrase [Sporolactobacillus sp. KGMB 08714]|uniref:tyrosine-type recombinase/integrase n=1 Tax=Sporolactobacillus sp. KGMB 08714 TaxID=3064704 RepID=UPI002FBDF5BD
MASISKRNGMWQYRVSYKDGGKYRNKTKGGFSTKREAQIAAAVIENLVGRGAKLKAGDQIFTDYFQWWYETYRKGKKSPENDRDVERAIKFAKKMFNGMAIKDIDKGTYQNALNIYAKNHSTSSVRKHHIYMRACFREAIEEDIIFKDPTFNAVTIGKVKEKKESLKYINYSDELRLVAEIVKDLRPRYISRYIILFGLATGCRFSEILGMTWDCINFKKHTARVNKTWDYQDTNDFGDTKNDASMRVISIDGKTCEILEQLKAAQTNKAVETGLRNIHNLCFVNDKMELVSNNAVNKCLKSLCAKLGIQEITCHSLRHTHASMLLYKGINIKYISRRLGHKSIITTLDTYSHIIDELQQVGNEQTMAALNSLYFSRKIGAK